MPTNSVILNEGFHAGNSGRCGAGPDTGFPAKAHPGGGPAAPVAATDGSGNQMTVMEQSFAVDGGFSANLTFRAALRAAQPGNAGTDGDVVSIRDSAGTVISRQAMRPSGKAWITLPHPVTFPAAGIYALHFGTGQNDGCGAIADDLAVPVGFAAGTLIDTDLGPRRVERLARGDRVWTADGGYQPIRWIAAHRVTVAAQAADDALWPVVIRAGAFGPGRPAHDLVLSQQQGICIRGERAEQRYGLVELLVPAQALVDGDGVSITPAQADVTFVQFLLDGHHLVRANGLESESFRPTAHSLRCLDRQSRATLTRVFPDLAALMARFRQSARPYAPPPAALQVARTQPYPPGIGSPQRKKRVMADPMESSGSRQMARGGRPASASSVAVT